MEIKDIATDNWVTLTAKVIQIWDNESPSIRQVGLLQDDTGIVKFVSWEKSNKPILQLDKTYKLTSMPVSTYQDRYSVAIVSTTDIERVEPEQKEVPVA